MGAIHRKCPNGHNVVVVPGFAGDTCPKCKAKLPAMTANGGGLVFGQDHNNKADAETAPAWAPDEPRAKPLPKGHIQVTMLTAIALAEHDPLQIADHAWRQVDGRCATGCGLPKAAHP